MASFLPKLKAAHPYLLLPMTGFVVAKVSRCVDLLVVSTQFVCLTTSIARLLLSVIKGWCSFPMAAILSPRPEISLSALETEATVAGDA